MSYATLQVSGFGYTLFVLNRLLGPTGTLLCVMFVIPVTFKMKSTCCSNALILRSALSANSKPLFLSTTSPFLRKEKTTQDQGLRALRKGTRPEKAGPHHVQTKEKGLRLRLYLPNEGSLAGRKPPLRLEPRTYRLRGWTVDFPAGEVRVT